MRSHDPNIKVDAALARVKVHCAFVMVAYNYLVPVGQWEYYLCNGGKKSLPPVVESECHDSVEYNGFQQP